MMVPFRSILAGLGAAAVAGVAMALWFQGLQYSAAISGTSGDSYYVVAHWHKGVVVLGLTLVFAAGFWWQYRKER
jgi:heme/copper-type cytochrome/quinol oxidase subunit 1